MLQTEYLARNFCRVEYTAALSAVLPTPVCEKNSICPTRSLFFPLGLWNYLDFLFRGTVAAAHRHWVPNQTRCSQDPEIQTGSVYIYIYIYSGHTFKKNCKRMRGKSFPWYSQGYCRQIYRLYPPPFLFESQSTMQTGLEKKEKV